MVKNLPASRGDTHDEGLNPTWEKSPEVFLPGKFHGRGAWGATVHEVIKSQARLSAIYINTFYTICIYINIKMCVCVYIYIYIFYE